MQAAFLLNAALNFSLTAGILWVILNMCCWGILLLLYSYFFEVFVSWGLEKYEDLCYNF